MTIKCTQTHRHRHTHIHTHTHTHTHTAMKSAMRQCLVKHGWVERQLVKALYVNTAGIDGVPPTPAVVYLQISQLFSLAYVSVCMHSS